MADEKKPAPSPPAAGKDMASKIAAAYRSIPVEELEKTLHPRDEVQNPDLDRTFDKLVETYRTKRPERDKAVVPFPRTSTAPLEAGGKKQGKADGCSECGHVNPPGNQFCGMCGASQELVEDSSPRRRSSDEEPEPATAGGAESGIKHHHHYYHHHHYRNNPYLLLAIVLLLGVIAWQQFHESQREVAGQPAVAAAAHTRIQPQNQPAQPAPSTEPQVPTEPPEQQPLTKPAAKSAPKQAPKRIAPAVPEVRVAEQAAEPTAPPPPESVVHKLLSNLFPSLVPPPSNPPKTGTPSSTSADQKK